MNLLLSKSKKIHLVGVAGISMSAIAEFLLDNGYTVSGSDIQITEKIFRLKKKGLIFYLKHCAENIKDVGALICTSAINSSNVEILEAKEKGIPILKRSQVLNEIISDIKNTIAVSGSHGKTTATNMIANAFIMARFQPTVFLGGEDKVFGNYKSGNKDYAVVEACEYKKNFLDIKPKVSVVLNIDNDHQDSYADMKDMVESFKAFINNTISIVNVDDPYAKNIAGTTSISFGIDNKATYMAKNIKYNGKGYSFTLFAFGRKICRIKLKVVGKHNVYNALACCAVCDIYKINFNTIKKSLESFDGVVRRAEYLGNLYSKSVYADYAHHPKEIEATIRAFGENGKKLGIIFQPHTFSRTKALMEEFVLSLKNNQVIIYKTYPAREKYDREGSAQKLFERLKNASESVGFAKNRAELVESLFKMKDKVDCFLFLGAGDIYNIAKNLT